MIGLEYGNTRLRAMRSRLLDVVDYDRLVSTDSLERMLAILADADYGPDVEAALARYRDLRRLDATVRNHLTRCYTAMRSFYEDPATASIDLLLQRWDDRNLISVLRAMDRPEELERLAERLVPAGRIDAASLRTLASQAGVRAVIDLAVVWGIPSGETARRLRRAWPEYERTGDISILEHAIASVFGRRLDAALGDDESAFARILRSEIDARNLVTVLRYREAILRGEPTPADHDRADLIVPGGRVAALRLMRLIDEIDAPGVVDAVARMPVPSAWLEAFTAWVEHANPSVLADALATAITTAAVDRFRGDPLGLDVPLAYTAALENEARNLRWIGRGIVHGLGGEEIRAGVVVV